MRLSKLHSVLFAAACTSAIPSVAFASGADACAGLNLAAAGECTLELSGSCQAQCESIDLVASCSGQCSGSATASCTGSCEGSCTAECEADVEAFDCEATCSSECLAHAEAHCGDDSSCRGELEASCSLECEAQCGSVQASGSCEAQCAACCEASCDVDANFECVAECSAELAADCQLDCQGEGALFCDGEYVQVEDLQGCLDYLSGEGGLSLGADGTGSFNLSCALASGAADHSGAALAWLALGLVGLRARRRRRS